MSDLMAFVFSNSEACGQEDPTNDENELGIVNVGGVFLVLGFGVLCAYIISICEFLWNIKTVAVEEKV
jgi:glutamate receptor, ionotropic, invertebrate